MKSCGGRTADQSRSKAPGLSRATPDEGRRRTQADAPGKRRHAGLPKDGDATQRDAGCRRMHGDVGNSATRSCYRGYARAPPPFVIAQGSPTAKAWILARGATRFRLQARGTRNGSRAVGR